MDGLNAAAKALEVHGFKVRMVETGAQAAAETLKEIGAGSVGFGGSLTVDGLGIYDTLKAQGNKVYWHWKCAKSEIPAIRREAMNADVYVSSSNAVTTDGKLVNIDGQGNRVSCMIFGPPKVIVIAGKNKITQNYDSAVDRIKTFACGPNARRLQLDTPCAKTGRCSDCSSPDRICSVIGVQERVPAGRQMIVYLVNEDLGY